MQWIYIIFKISLIGCRQKKDELTMENQRKGTIRKIMLDALEHLIYVWQSNNLNKRSGKQYK